MAGKTLPIRFTEVVQLGSLGIQVSESIKFPELSEHASTSVRDKIYTIIRSSGDGNSRSLD
jgi:hypothetical protein